MNAFQSLHFQPALGLSSKHAQMIVSAYLPIGKAPPSEELIIPLNVTDKLSCHLSTPHAWQSEDKTVILIHGLGGDHGARYMVRMARKLYQRGHRALRVNLRNCGSGAGLSRLPYSAGNSEDLRKVVEYVKDKWPYTKILLTGFSLGGNIALKLAGELGVLACKYLAKVIAVCPSIDLEASVKAITKTKNLIYHKYYLKNALLQAFPWVTCPINSLREFDERVTAPSWGFGSALEYYQQCSSKHYISRIQAPSHILFAKDDPFVSINSLENVEVPKNVNIWVTERGSHMGFVSSFFSSKGPNWLDHCLLQWVDASH